MKFTTFLAKSFDIETCNRVIPDENGKNITELWVYEKGEDCEPLLILRATEGVSGWIVANVYSELPDGLQVNEEQFKKMVKNGEVKSKFEK